MKGPDSTAAEDEGDVQDVAAGPSADDAVPPLAAVVVAIYPDAPRVGDDRFGVVSRKAVFPQMLEVRFILLEQGFSHDSA